MPYKISKLPSGRYKLINSSTGKVHAYHTTLLKAKAQMRLLEGIKHNTLIPRRKKK